MPGESVGWSVTAPVWARDDWELAAAIAAIVLTLIAFWLSTEARRKANRMEADITRRLSNARLGGRLADLEMAGHQLVSAGSAAALRMACRFWIEASADARALMDTSSDDLSAKLEKQLLEIFGMIAVSLRQLDRNVRVALAAEELKAAVDSAVSTARELRTKLEARQA
jgi:hypothetical protein